MRKHVLYIDQLSTTD